MASSPTPRSDLHDEAQRALLPIWAAVPASVAAGLLLTLAFPPTGWWAVVLVAVPLSLVALIGRRWDAALLVGFAFGIAFFLVNLSFTARYLGPVPWLALSILEAALTAVMAVPIALAYRWVPRAVPGAVARLVLLPALIGGLWVVRELVLGTFPYGGFPWGRIGVTQVDGPFAELASWGGMSGLSFVVVMLCAAAIEYVRLRRFRDVRTLLPSVVLLAILLLVPQYPTTPAGTMRVGAAQGNGPTGYFDERAPNEVLNAQIDATVPLLDEDVDVIVWPEGGVDSDPLQNDATAAALDALSERANAPLLIAAITERDGLYFNTSLVWTPEGPAGGYDKHHPVPFGEYVPDRAFYRLFAPDLIDLIGRDYTPGSTVPFVTIDGVGVGLAICFDVIYDDVVWAGAREGAEIFMFQTNNADFRGTSENLQQLAFAKMRAIETGRSVVNISTVGTSQIIAPDGSELDGLPADVAGHLLADVPLRTGATPAVAAGAAIPVALVVLSLGGLIAAGVGARVRRRSSPA